MAERSTASLRYPWPDVTRVLEGLEVYDTSLLLNTPEQRHAVDLTA